MSQARQGRKDGPSIRGRLSMTQPGELGEGRGEGGGSPCASSPQRKLAGPHALLVAGAPACHPASLHGSITHYFRRRLPCQPCRTESLLCNEQARRYWGADWRCAGRRGSGLKGSFALLTPPPPATRCHPTAWPTCEPSSTCCAADGVRHQPSLPGTARSGHKPGCRALLGGNRRPGLPGIC